MVKEQTSKLDARLSYLFDLIKKIAFAFKKVQGIKLELQLTWRSDESHDLDIKCLFFKERDRRKL